MTYQVVESMNDGKIKYEVVSPYGEVCVFSKAGKIDYEQFNGCSKSMQDAVRITKIKIRKDLKKQEKINNEKRHKYIDAKRASARKLKNSQKYGDKQPTAKVAVASKVDLAAEKDVFDLVDRAMIAAELSR